MFLWDLVVDNIMEQFLDWIYGQIVAFLSEFLSMINMMGAEIFEMDWVKGIVQFFGYFAWALFVVGLVVAVFDTVIEMQNGKGNLRDLALNIVKSFMAVSLFTIVPVELYKFCITLQSELAVAISGLSSTTESISTLGIAIVSSFVIPGSGAIIGLVFIVLVGYAIIKIFFGNLKRSGILLAMIAVGSLYMFSVPRGYMDGFIGWCKQVIALCLTAFLQTLILVAGLITFNTNMIVGIGLMLSATEVPRIAGNFGLDTSMKFNVMSTVYSAQSAVNLVKSVAKKMPVK